MTGRPTTTRRQLLRGALTATGAGAGGAGVAQALIAGDAAAADPPQSDAQLLYKVLTVEQIVEQVYVHVIDATVLSPEAQRLATKVLAQERAHVAAVSAELAKLGATAPVPPITVTAIDLILTARHVSGRLSDVRTETDAIHLLLAVESIVEGAHYDAITKLHRVPLQVLSAEILASEAQHYTVLSDYLHPGEVYKSVPYAFVEGTR